MAAGEMPALADLCRRAARFRLDHGPAQRTGLAWEHVASGLSPEAGRRWAAVEFDPIAYDAWQEGARFAPWWAGLDRRVVVFDAPYVDLSRAPNTRGVVAWGAHDPGSPKAARPARPPRGVRGSVRRLPCSRVDLRNAVSVCVAHAGDGRVPRAELSTCARRPPGGSPRSDSRTGTSFSRSRARRTARSRVSGTAWTRTIRSTSIRRRRPRARP